MLLLGRAAQWAAGVDSEVKVSAVLGRGPAHVKRGAADKAGEVVLNSTVEVPVMAGMQLVRAEDGATFKLGDTAVGLLPGRPVALPVTVPTLRAGDYYLNVVVRSKRGNEACGAGTVVVESDYGVEELTVDRTFIERGQRINGTAHLRGSAPDKSLLRVRFRDTSDRVLAQQDFPVKAGQSEYSFNYKADAFATILMRVEAVLVTAGAEVEQQTTSFTVPKRRQGQMNFTMWDTPQDSLGYYVWQQLKAAGYNISLIDLQRLIDADVGQRSRHSNIGEVRGQRELQVRVETPEGVQDPTQRCVIEDHGELPALGVGAHRGQQAYQNKQQTEANNAFHHLPPRISPPTLGVPHNCQSRPARMQRPSSQTA